MEQEEYNDILVFLQRSQKRYPSAISTNTNLKRNFRRKCSNFKIENEELWYKQTKGRPSLKVVRVEEAKEILSSIHCKSGCHLGVLKTWSLIRSRYYWKGTYEDVQQFVKSCDVCQRKGPLKKAKKPLQSIPVPASPFQQIGMDLIGPLKTTNNGNKYILVFTDYFSKWAEAEPLKDKTAHNVVVAFETFVTRHGCPQTLITDQGKEFCNSINELFCKNMGIQHRVASAYHPETGGHTERFNRTLCSMLTGCVNDEHDNWDQMLPCALFAYRSSVHASTKKTPFYLVYGREAILPIELDISNEKQSHEGDEEELMNSRCQSFTNLHVERETASVHIKQSQQKQKKYHDAKLTDTCFKIGQDVLLHNTRKNTRKGGKLESNWSGPFKIKDVLSKGAYSLDGKKGIVNGSRLKLYKTENDTTHQQHKEETNKQETLDSESKTKEEEAHGKDIEDSDSNRINEHKHSLPPKKRKFVFDDSDDELKTESFEFNPVDDDWRTRKSKVFNKSVKKPFESGRPRVVNRAAKPTKVVPVRGDGNCLFRSFSYCLFGEQTYHKHVRKHITAFMKANENLMKKVESRSMPEYLSQTKMAASATWGTETEIFAFATITKTTVNVYCRTGGRGGRNTYGWLPYKPLSSELETLEPKAVFIHNKEGNHFEPVLDVD